MILAAAAVDAPVSTQLAAEPTRTWIERIISPPLAGAPYLIILAILASSPNRWRLWLGFLVPVLGSAAVLHVLKWAIGRARPLLGAGVYHFEPLSGASHCDSFPSGHTVAVGTLALLLGVYFPRARWLFYTLALLAGLERIVTRWHFLSDVLAGYALAALTVLLCVRWLGPSCYRLGWPAESAAMSHTVSSRPLT